MPSTYINPITRERATILKTAAQTAGAYTLIEVELQPGGGNPIHYHKQFTEDFHPIQGDLGIHYKGKEMRLSPGNSFKVPLLDLHRFYNPSDHPIIFQARLEPGQPGFENFMAVLFGLVKDGKTFSKNQIPYNPFYAALLLEWGDTYISSYAFKAALPGVRWMAALARKLKLEQHLLRRYGNS
jgi:mannose-6-phosphate isomerase-like protein (cupin superfamily)